jgi:hypothetical protein
MVLCVMQAPDHLYRRLVVIMFEDAMLQVRLASLQCSHEGYDPPWSIPVHHSRPRWCCWCG